MFSIRKSSPANSLNPPPGASDAGSREILRVWERPGHGQEVTLLANAFADANGRVDPATWGLMLVDVAQHVANAYATNLGADRAVVLARIKAGFDAEWNAPTDVAKEIK